MKYSNIRHATGMLILHRVPRFLLAAILSLCFFSSASFAQSDLIIKPLNAEAGSVSLYQLEFRLSEELPPDAVISIVFDEVFDLSQLNIASSASILGGLSVQRRGNIVWIFREGNGPALKPGTRVSLWLSAIGNAKRIGSPTITLRLYKDRDKIIRGLREKKEQTLLSAKTGVTGVVNLTPKLQ